MTMGAQDSFTIDELAAAVGMTPRNVRAYRTKGLLPPPVRDGRASRYRIAHLRRLRDVRALREAGLPLKMIISAAGRGEDLGPNGALWLATGRTWDDAQPDEGTSPDPPAYLADPRAYAIMQALSGRGLAPATVLLIALRTAHTSHALAVELHDLLALEATDPPEAGSAPSTPQTGTGTIDGTVTQAQVIDLVTIITQEVLGQTLNT
jgi:DNA-binding transcriptional MerR regulator